MQNIRSMSGGEHIMSLAVPEIVHPNFSSLFSSRLLTACIASLPPQLEWKMVPGTSEEYRLPRTVSFDS